MNNLNLSFIRGDTINIKFKRTRKDGSIIKDKPEKMYFTIKLNHNVDSYIIQKTLDEGIYYNPDDNCYYVTIEPKETDNLQYRNYVFDIEIINANVKKTLALGTIAIEREVTFASNE